MGIRSALATPAVPDIKPATGAGLRTLAVAVDEYRLLCSVFAGAIDIRDQGAKDFMRLPAGMRLAITTLAANYRDRGLDDRGLPTKDAVERLFALAAERAERTVPVTSVTITDTEILELWRSGAIDTRERDRAIRKARQPHHAAWRRDARERCAKLINARGGK